MATPKRNRPTSAHKSPSVRIARPAGRPFQLRYTDPGTGREVRISCGSRDEDLAEQLKAELEAKVLLGLETAPRKHVRGPAMPWDEFREEYRRRHLCQLRVKSQSSMESRLDLAERILKPSTLGDVANSDALTKLQADLLAGKESRFGKPRSAHTAKSHLVSVLASLSWACEMGWIPAVPKVRKVKVSKLRQMKGRPINLEEFERMLACTTKVTGPAAAQSWQYVLKGLWESGLRLDELMHVHWTDANCIRPVWARGRLPVLAIPADMQKNATEESIALLPRFEELLLETRETQRTGWVFNPASLQAKVGRKSRNQRPDADWVGKVISRIGKAAGIIVRSDGQMKYASAHDLRRSCAERLFDLGLPERVVAHIMRHASSQTTLRYYSSGNAQQAGGALRDVAAAVPRYTSPIEST